MVVVYPENVWYAGVQARDLPEILESHILDGRPVERLRYEPGVPGANKTDVGPKKDTAAAKAAPQWKRVCASSDVPDGGMKEFLVDGIGVLVVKAAGGFVAFQAMCPHEAIPLEAGIHDGCTLTCLEHMWQFDLRTGAPMGDATEGLKGYPIREDKGELYVATEG
jgi:nitrite reductase/ring-hydroxylating ferredoxin subunit/(2Fe-2S) ferredoxin